MCPKPNGKKYCQVKSRLVQGQVIILRHRYTNTLTLSPQPNQTETNQQHNKNRNTWSVKGNLTLEGFFFLHFKYI